MKYGKEIVNILVNTYGPVVVGVVMGVIAGCLIKLGKTKGPNDIYKIKK